MPTTFKEEVMSQWSAMFVVPDESARIKFVCGLYDAIVETMQAAPVVIGRWPSEREHRETSVDYDELDPRNITAAMRMGLVGGIIMLPDTSDPFGEASRQDALFEHLAFYHPLRNVRRYAVVRPRSERQVDSDRVDFMSTMLVHAADRVWIVRRQDANEPVLAARCVKHRDALVRTDHDFVL